MNNTNATLYTLLATIFCLTTFFEPYPYSWLVKILPMLVLLNLTWRRASSKLFVYAILFSTLGDVALALQGGELFIWGLGAFLIGHLFFIRSFQPISSDKKKYIAPYCIFAMLIFYLMAPNLKAFFLPVLIYVLVLLAMASSALLSKHSNIWMILGGTSFLISDSLIGIEKFYSDFAASHFFIMVTYYFAQFALVKGYLKAHYYKMI